jgi:tetratricopeptide (TPR) repeat protein
MAGTTAHRKRLTKHELKEDKLITFAYTLWDRIERHRTAVLFSALGVIGAVAVVLLYQRSATSDIARAEELLYRAMTDYEAGRYTEASNGLAQFVERYPRHMRRAVAAVALANCRLGLGLPAEAEAHYKMAADVSQKGSDAWVSAKIGLGRVARAQGSLDAALGYFQEAASAAVSKELAAEAAAEAIDAKLRAGDRSGAVALLETVERDHARTAAAGRFSALRGRLQAARP